MSRRSNRLRRKIQSRELRQAVASSAERRRSQDDSRWVVASRIVHSWVGSWRRSVTDTLEEGASLGFRATRENGSQTDEGKGSGRGQVPAALDESAAISGSCSARRQIAKSSMGSGNVPAILAPLADVEARTTRLDRNGHVDLVDDAVVAIERQLFSRCVGFTSRVFGNDFLRAALCSRRLPCFRRTALAPRKSRCGLNQVSNFVTATIAQG